MVYGTNSQSEHLYCDNMNYKTEFVFVTVL